MSLDRPHSFKIVKPVQDARVGQYGLVVVHGTKNVYDDAGSILPVMLVGEDTRHPVCVVAGHITESSSGKVWTSFFHTDHLKLGEQIPASITLYRILTPGGHAVVLFPAPPRRVQLMPLQGGRTVTRTLQSQLVEGNCKSTSGNVEFITPADSKEYQFHEVPCADGVVTSPATAATKAELYIDDSTEPEQTLNDIDLSSGYWSAMFDPVSSGKTCTIKVYVNNNGLPGTTTNPFYNGQ